MQHPQDVLNLLRTEPAQVTEHYHTAVQEGVACSACHSRAPRDTLYHYHSSTSDCASCHQFPGDRNFEEFTKRRPKRGRLY